MKKAYLFIVFAYLVAGATALLAGSLFGEWHPILAVAAADLAGTVVIFGFSVYKDNSSVYDAYWSVAPVLIAAYWLTSSVALPETGNVLRQIMVMALVLVWSARLTLNWALRWRGMGHEDWRYAELREKHGRGYWVVSFFGVHLMPTVLVFLGCLPLVPSLGELQRAAGTLDLIALLVTGFAIWIEARADLEVTRFKKTGKGKAALLQTGLWSLSRHPNYFGEILFWWGLFLFGLAADPGYWWTVIGPLAITVLFLTISIPMIEKRLLSRKPEYAAYKEITPALIPWRSILPRH